MQSSKIYISLFQSVHAANAKTISLDYFLDPQNWKQQVDYVRAAKTKEERKARKLKLPAVTLSGFFNGRKADYLVEHSGLICIDIDRQDNPHIENFESIKYECANISNVAYAGASVSGIENGVFLIIPIELPAKLENETWKKYAVKCRQLHTQYFQSLKKIFQDRLKIIIDKQCGNVDRLRFVSYDTDPFYNWDAIPFKMILPERQIKRSKPSKDRTYSTTPLSYKSKLGPFDIAYRYAEKRAGQCVDGNKHNFILQFATILNRMGISEQDTLFYVENTLNIAVGSNCISFPYSAHHAEHGTFTECIQ